MSVITIALAQMDLALGKPERNLETVRQQVRAAKERGADLILLPELWSTAYDLENAARHASSVDQGMFVEVERLAREHAIAIAGSLLESDGKRFYNTATLIDGEGNRLGAYRKLHLVPMLAEDQYLAGGDRADVFETPFGRIALAICYDLRFPELWRHYALAGACLVLLPAEWPQQRIAPWRTLIPARAIENQFFVAATNRVGASKGEAFGGRSMVVNPWGEILVEGDENPSLFIAPIDLDLVDEVRGRVPVFRDRRDDVYSKWEAGEGRGIRQMAFGVHV